MHKSGSEFHRKLHKSLQLSGTGEHVHSGVPSKNTYKKECHGGKVGKYAEGGHVEESEMRERHMKKTNPRRMARGGEPEHKFLGGLMGKAKNAFNSASNTASNLYNKGNDLANKASQGIQRAQEVGSRLGEQANKFAGAANSALEGAKGIGLGDRFDKFAGNAQGAIGNAQARGNAMGKRAYDAGSQANERIGRAQNIGARIHAGASNLHNELTGGQPLKRGGKAGRHAMGGVAKMRLGEANAFGQPRSGMRDRAKTNREFH